MTTVTPEIHAEKKKFGRYLVDLWANKVFTLEDGSGGTRTFKIARYYAYDAGIIGSEYNGVVVLDEDYKAIIVDKILQGRSAEAQRQALWELLSANTWDEFREILLTDWVKNSRLPGKPDHDLHSSSPDYILPPSAEDNRQLIFVDQEGPEGDPCIVYTEKNREDIIKELSRHETYSDGYHRKYRLSWNVKLYRCNTEGKVGDHEVNPAFDERWENEVESEDLFEETVQNYRLQYEEGEYCTFPGGDQGSYSTSFAGRSGGYIVLDAMDGQKLAWACQNDMIDDLREMPDEKLVKLYRATLNLDHDLDIQRIKQSINQEFNDRRHAKEEGWNTCIASFAPEGDRVKNEIFPCGSEPENDLLGPLPYVSVDLFKLSEAAEALGVLDLCAAVHEIVSDIGVLAPEEQVVEAALEEADLGKRQLALWNNNADPLTQTAKALIYLAAKVDVFTDETETKVCRVAPEHAAAFVTKMQEITSNLPGQTLVACDSPSM